MSKEKIVCVEWDDASFYSGYYDKNAPKRYEPAPTKTVGMVIKSTRREIVLGTDSWVSDDGEIEYRHCHTIPKKMIKKINHLKE